MADENLTAATLEAQLATQLTHKLGLLVLPGRETMIKFAISTRDLQAERKATLDQAAMIAAKDTFPSEFQPTNYNTASDPIHTLIADIEKLF
jgi:hypothetical protein